ncbi:MAG TPA: DMT family transporter [Terriglobales bacterium]|jgi:drug/metabolite transporter (DMT)-like permease|nr:DMT family transporter [Terriglobales bacterium]
MASQSRSEIAGAGASQPASIRGYLFIAAAALCWGISASLGRAAFTGRLVTGQALPPIGPLILAQTRVTLALLVLAPVLLARRGPPALRMSRGDVVRALLIGVLGVAASNYFYYLAIQKTNVATAIILQYTAPVWVLVYMVARGVQRATASRVLSVGLAVVGSALAIGVVGTGQFRINLVGLAAAMAAAFSFAYYNIFIPPLLTRHDRWKVLLYILMGTALFWLAMNPPWRVFAEHYSQAQWGFLALFSLTSVLLPFSFYIAGLQYLDSTRAVVTSSLEPVFSILIAAITLGELVRPVQVIGIVIVLTATVLVQMSGKEEIVEPIE